MTNRSLKTLDEEAAEVCRILEWWSGRMEGHQTNKRSHPRFKFRKQLSAYVAESDAYGSTEEWSSVLVNARNISIGGIGFLTVSRLPEGRIIVCLNSETLLLGKIVRQRKVHRGYWDIGVAFAMKLDPEKDAELWPFPRTECLAP